jgi:hypothetical protein
MPLRERRVSNQSAFQASHGAAETASHFPRGHRSVAIRNLAHVLQPHFLQRPVSFNAAASHHSHVEQISRRFLTSSSVAISIPAPINFLEAP